MTTGLVRIRGRALLAALVATAATLVLASVGSGAPPLKQKEAQAQAVEAQVSALNVQLGRTVEAYDGARYRLGQIRVAVKQNGVALRRARDAYRVAQRRAAQRLVAIYELGEPTTADALLGAVSLSDMLDRIEAVNSATALDRRIVLRVRSLHRGLARRAHTLSVARHQQTQTVSTLAEQRRQIESSVGRQQRLLSSIRSQVATLQAQERARQRRLLLAARARLAAQKKAEAAAARRAAARERAVEEAAAAAAARRAAETTTRAPTTTEAAPPPTTTAPATTAPATTTAPTTTAPAPTTTTPTTTAAAPPPPPTTTPPPPTTTAPAPPTPPAPPTAAGHPAAASIALRYLGVPYKWGGSTPSGFDCSGLVMYVYAQLGISLPHFAAAQYQLGVPVPRADLRPGDLVFFDGLNHVGIWIGGGEFVHAPETGDVVKIEPLTGWYAQNYVGARRI